jgi:hypothetical protein
MNKKKIFLVLFLISALPLSLAFGDFYYADSPEFPLDLPTLPSGGAYDFAESPQFGLDLYPVHRGWANSATFFLDISSNTPPVADAGPDQSVHAGTVVTVDGSGSSDPDENYPLTFSWQITSVPQGSLTELWDADTVNPTFIPDVMGNYVVDLIVTDAKGAQSTSDSVLVSTWNTPPVADAGGDQVLLYLNSTVQLGTDPSRQSYDDDGDDITYLWTISTKPEGSTAALDDPTSATPTFQADKYGMYEITVVVTDSFGAQSEPDAMTVSFTNVKPIADAGGNQAAVTGDMVLLDGSGSYDLNGDPLSYSWSLVSKPEGSVTEIADPTLVQTSFIADQAGTYVVSLVVNDGFLDSDADNVTIEVITVRDALVQTLLDLIDVVNALDPSSLKNVNMMKNPMTNKINAVLNKIDRGFYDEALDKLQNDILQKTNGCAEIGEPDKNDWIITCEAQGQVYPLIMEAIELLEALI